MSLEISTGLQVLLLALAFDLIIGEPPARFHPVVWIGRLISLLRILVPVTKPGGLMLAIVAISTTVAAGHLLVWAAGLFPGAGTLAASLVAAYLLKSTFAVRCLLQTSAEIGEQIDGDLSQAKVMLPALVGRKTEDLTRTQAASAVIESLSENYVDSILSPIFYFLIFEPAGLGLQAALAFKAISTMDSMLGYRTEELKDLGFVPARLDDLANFIPARISIILIAAARPWMAGKSIGAALRYHKATPSPNSGWPMSAASGALGLRLEKPGYYVLLEEGRDPTAADVSSAIRLVAMTAALTIAASALALAGL